jgi:hypothetical protein
VFGAIDTSSPAYAAAVGVAVVVALAFAPLRRAASSVVTLAHELGHAAVALAVGGKVTRVSVRLDASGETLTLVGGKAPNLRLALFALAGYPAPGVVGIVAAWAASTADHRTFLLVSAVIVALVLVLWVRNPWGLLVCVVTVVGLWVVAVNGGEVLARTVTIAAAWTFAIGGLQASWALASGRSRPRTGLDDALRVAQLSRVVPRGVVAAGFVMLRP